MLDTNDIDLATSNISCRILVISPSPAQATTLIRRIQALGSSTDSRIQETAKVCSGKRDLLSPDLVKIPWTIENKYYSADVHFAVHPMRGLAPYLLQNIPAVMFVWRSNEAYKHHLERISRDLDGHEPEITLAVRVNPSSDEVPPEPIDEEGEEENASIDEFMSRFGFEYVDATLDIADYREERYEQKEDFDGIPSLPRVVDALSTIMWPSMKARDRRLKHGNVQLRHDPTLLDWATDDGTDRSLPSLDGLVATSSSQLSAQAQRMKNEMDELTKWLENDVLDGNGEDPWRMAATSDIMVASPTEDGGESWKKKSSTTSRSEQTGSSKPPDFAAKFDDDFTVFVSAPAADESGQGSGHSTPVADELEYQDGLKPPGELRIYNSLGSVSDFGGSDGGKEAAHVLSDDEDEELPSRDEILETSARIFGKRSEASPTEDSQGLRELAIEEQSGDDEAQLDEEDEYKLAPFDLTRVLGTLQQMKEEISGMETEDERRKAAARVALGLVYGLEEKSD